MVLIRPFNIAFSILFIYIKCAALLYPIGVVGVIGVIGIIVTLLQLIRKVSKGIKNIN